MELLNPKFEEGFRYVDSVREVLVANNWWPWWDQGSARPEWKNAHIDIDARRVREGVNAQQWFNNYATHTGGILQRISGLPAQGKLFFGAWLQCFSSNKDDFSHSEGRYRMNIGIDPYGGGDFRSSDIVWANGGHALQPYDRYEYVQVETPARADRCTVFVWGQAEWALKHNNAYVDDCIFLIEGGSPGPGPGPEPCNCKERWTTMINWAASVEHVMESLKEELK
jgi:hypothetical protein